MPYTRTGDFACTALVVQLRAPAPIGPLLFVNHFPNWQLAFEYERELQAVVVARAIEELVDAQAQPLGCHGRSMLPRFEASHLCHLELSGQASS